MAPFKLTAQQYSECWRERIEKEQRALAVQLTQEALEQITSEDQQQQTGGSRPPSVAGSVAKPKSEISIASVSQLSYVSSRVSEGRSGRTAAQKVEMLQKKLEQEKHRRKELEMQLKRASVAE